METKPFVLINIIDDPYLNTPVYHKLTSSFQCILSFKQNLYCQIDKGETDKALFLVPGGTRSPQRTSGTSFVLVAEIVTLHKLQKKKRTKEVR